MLIQYPYNRRWKTLPLQNEVGLDYKRQKEIHYSVMETIIDFLVNKCCCCWEGSGEKSSDDDQIAVKTAVVCCVRTQEIKIDLCDDGDGENAAKQIIERRRGTVTPLLQIRKYRCSTEQSSSSASKSTLYHTPTSDLESGDGVSKQTAELHSTQKSAQASISPPKNSRAHNTGAQ